MLLSTALLITACSDNGPTSPSPMPTVPTTPPTTTTRPGQADTVPQVAGLYRGEYSAGHIGAGITGRPVPVCMDVVQDGTTVTMSSVFAYRGTIESDGRLTNVRSLLEDNEILSDNIRFDKDLLLLEINVTWRKGGAPSGTSTTQTWNGKPHRLRSVNEGPPTEKCEPQQANGNTPSGLSRRPRPRGVSPRDRSTA